jgi:hypothetical protein
MSEFLVYFKLGYQHITDLNGFDHILFLVALCAVYGLTSWKKVLILVTAFTVGHSITLALSSLGYVPVNAALVERLIPLTILLTCLANFFYRFPKSIYKDSKSNNAGLRYAIAVIFGLIHGLGFSTYLKSLLGTAGNITLPLFSFNLGLELGQIVIVILILFLSFLVTDIFKVKKRTWNLIASGIVFGMALMMILER